MANHSQAEVEMSQFPQVPSFQSSSVHNLFQRPELEMAASTSSVQTRNGKHGMMAKCECLMSIKRGSNC